MNIKTKHVFLYLWFLCNMIIVWKRTMVKYYLFLPCHFLFSYLQIHYILTDFKNAATSSNPYMFQNTFFKNVNLKFMVHSEIPDYSSLCVILWI